MLLAAPSWLTEGAVYVGSLTTFAVALGGFFKSKPGRWLMRQFAEDIEGFVGHIAERVARRALELHKDVREQEMVAAIDEHLPRHLEPVLHELRTNGGGSFRDQTVEQLRHITRRMDRFDTFMDESTMDRLALRRLFEAEISRTKAAERGEVNDRGER